MDLSRCIGRLVGLEVEGGEVGFVDFAEAEGVGDEAFASFDFYEVFATLPAVVEGETNGVLVVVGFKVPFASVCVTVVLHVVLRKES